MSDAMTDQPNYQFATGSKRGLTDAERAAGWRTEPRELWANVYRGTLSPDGVTVWDEKPQLMRLV